MTAAPTAELSEFTARLGVDNVPTQVVEQVKVLILDSLGVCQFVAARTPWGEAMVRFADRSGVARQPAQIFGSSVQTNPPAAALANGTLAMGFEFEDMHTRGTGHPFSIVFPAAVATAESCGASSADLVAAVVAGYEVGVRVSLGLSRHDEPWTQRGLYPITLFGVFGSAAAAARALSLDAGQTLNALGIAGSHAFGTMQAHKEGAMARRLHAGRAAEIGVTAAALAAEGFTGPSAILDGEFGIYNAFGTSPADLGPITEGLGQDWAPKDAWLKNYPCNGLFQAPIDALLHLVATNGLEPTEIDHVRVTIPLATRLHGRPSAVTPVNAQFSLHYCMALALIRGRPTATMFLEGEVGADDVVAAMDKIDVTLDPDMSRRVSDSSRPGKVELALSNGDTISHGVAYPKGHPKDPMRWADVESKFRTLVTGILAEKDADSVVQRVRDLGDGQRTPVFFA